MLNNANHREGVCIRTRPREMRTDRLRLKLRSLRLLSDERRRQPPAEADQFIRLPLLESSLHLPLLDAQSCRSSAFPQLLFLKVRH